MRAIARGLARSWFRARGAASTRIRGVALKTDPYHVGFWRDVSAGRWEPELFDLLDRFLHPGSVFVDVGAWIGPASIYAAMRCERVYSFEPDPDAYEYLLWNARLNHLRNLVPFNLALTSRWGLRSLGSPDGELGTSKSTLVGSAVQGDPVPVLGIPWDAWLDMAAPGRIDLMKIDIEGGEFELVPSIRDYLRENSPALHLSLHAPVLPDEERAERIGEVLAALTHYASIGDETGQSLRIEELRARAMERFCTVVASGARRASHP